MPEDLCNDFCVTELVKVNDFAAPVVVILKIIALPLHNSLLLIHSLIFSVVFKDRFYSRLGKKCNNLCHFFHPKPQENSLLWPLLRYSSINLRNLPVLNYLFYHLYFFFKLYVYLWTIWACFWKPQLAYTKGGWSLNSSNQVRFFVQWRT